LDMRPILRVRHNTWDSLVAGQATLNLPDHLADAFGRRTITTPEFGASWKQVVEEQKQLCNRMAEMRKPLDLLAFLIDRDPVGSWDERRAAYLEAKQAILSLRAQAEEVQKSVNACYADLRARRARSQQVQRDRGDHFRSVKDWTPTEIEKRES